MERLELRMLGELEVCRGREVLALPNSKKTRALLAYLALTGRPHRRQRLTELFWDVTDDPKAALRWSLSRLRSALGSDCIVADRREAGVNVAHFSVDLHAVKRICQDVDQADAEQLARAVSCFRGEPLAGLDLPDFDTYQAFLIAERETARKWHGRLLRALLRLLTDEPEAALPYAQTLVQIDPFDVAVRVDVVERLRALGRTREADQQLEAAERALSEIGAAKNPALTALKRTPLQAAAHGAPSRAPSATAPQDTANVSPGRQTAGAPPSPIQRSTVHGHRLVGRDAERERIGDFIEAVSKTRRARVLLVQGEPGIGKTRLLLEALIHARRKRGLVLEGAANEAEPSRPFGPWVDSLRRAPAATLGPTGPSLEPFTGGAQQAEHPLSHTLSEMVRERTSKAPLMLVALDDLQWFPAPSCDVLFGLIRDCRELPLAIVVTVREAELVDNLAAVRLLRSLRRERLVDGLNLGPLDRNATAELVHMIRADVDVDRVYADSAGNPLFALEIARAGGETHSSSPSLSAVVRERIERLPPEAMEVLRWAAVLGPTFRARLLETLVGRERNLLDALEALERHGLIGGVVDLQQPGDLYEFAHQLVREVVYGELSMPRRRLMHARVAEALVGGDGSAADRAHHAMQGGDPVAAVDACLGAARRCLDLLAPQQAQVVARRGLFYAETLAEPQRSDSVRALQSLAEQAARAMDERAAPRPADRRTSP